MEKFLQCMSKGVFTLVVLLGLSVFTGCEEEKSDKPDFENAFSVNEMKPKLNKGLLINMGKSPYGGYKFAVILHNNEEELILGTSEEPFGFPYLIDSRNDGDHVYFNITSKDSAFISSGEYLYKPNAPFTDDRFGNAGYSIKYKLGADEVAVVKGEFSSGKMYWKKIGVDTYEMYFDGIIGSENKNVDPVKIKGHYIGKFVMEYDDTFLLRP